MKYTKRDGDIVVYFLKKSGFRDAKLIGSLGKGKTSKHDIDILLSKHKHTTSVSNALIYLFEPKSHEETDWGGLYLKDTFFGDIDIFFTMKDFDY